MSRRSRLADLLWDLLEAGWFTRRGITTVAFSIMFALIPVYCLLGLAAYGASADFMGYFWGTLAMAAWLFVVVRYARDRRAWRRRHDP